MYDMDCLKAEITRLFYARMDRGGHTPEEIRQYLGGLDFQALTQTVRDRARTVYAYTTQGRHEKSFNYRGEELFGQRATLLYAEDDQSTAEAAVTTRTLELWLLEDMGLAAVACITVDYENGEYITEYRAMKGDPAECEMCLDLEELAQALDQMCWPWYEHEQPVYEL